MGRALEPGGTFSIVLDWDMDKPEEQRPTIYTVALSMRRQERLGELLDAAPKASKDRKSTRLNFSHVSESRMPSSA